MLGRIHDLRQLIPTILAKKQERPRTGSGESNPRRRKRPSYRLCGKYLFALMLSIRGWKHGAEGGSLHGRCGAAIHNKEKAERFLEYLREPLAHFGLELHPEKTRLSMF